MSESVMGEAPELEVGRGVEPPASDGDQVVEVEPAALLAAAALGTDESAALALSLDDLVFYGSGDGMAA
jgi:hypothetical protein